MEGLRGLTGRAVVDELRERYAETARQRASLLEAVWETVLCDSADSTHRLTEPDEWAPDEVRAALGLTRKAANLLVGEAHAIVHRLPQLHAAMAAGELDQARARVLADWTLELADDHAHAVCAALLPRCELSAQTRLSTGQLVDQIKTMAIALDPEWARRRYEAKVAGRRVVASRDPEGTASLSGLSLPVERVAAASARIEALARSARRGGDKRPIDHIRAELFLGMTDGTYTGLTDDQILTALLTAHHREDGGGAHQADQGQTGEKGDAGDGKADQVSRADSRGTTPAPSMAVDSAAVPPSEPASEPASGSASDPVIAPAPTPVPVPSWAGVHLKVRLSTLLGLDRYPAELAGWGTCHAELATQMARELGAAQWRYTFTCPDGYLIRTGLMSTRPTGSKKRAASCAGVVEILVPAALLPRLFGPDADLMSSIAPDLIRAWDPVLFDLTEKLHDPKTQRLLDPRRRAPGAALRREVTTAITTCVGAGCRAPARASDVDHLHDHAKGGLTVAANLDPMCRHDHRVKTEAGWQLRRVNDTFEWTTRLGHLYLVPIPPVLPDLPKQRPGPGSD
ncbi:MAG: DUF222 domain-containing protein, partial [Sporichthyaceae bacterium]